ncbi:DNA adenine methylase [Cuniculiplasma sp. SKW4]|uniref:DNA adenine methylase n=1 Tax=Cuniculiplasma sp. SKW4 TaxID=3400171 RepID=UPI003FD52CF4
MNQYKSLIAYPGGKYYMLPDILKIINETRKSAIVDVFGGSGKVLMNVNARVKVYNDLNADLVNFFEEVRNHRDKVIEKLDYVLNSRELFLKYMERTEDPIENAFRYIYRNILSFNGQGKSYSYSTKRNKSIKLLKAWDIINSLYDEIKLWTIERLDFRDLIKKYDSENTFFYLDPPYHNIRGLYDYEMEDRDFLDLKYILEEIQGKYLLNINEDEFVRSVFGEPSVRKEYVNYGTNGRLREKTRRIELFYYNIQAN